MEWSFHQGTSHTRRKAPRQQTRREISDQLLSGSMTLTSRTRNARTSATGVIGRLPSDAPDKFAGRLQPLGRA